MKHFLIFFLVLFLISCEEENNRSLDEDTLADYIQLNQDLTLTDLIACAAGLPEGLPMFDEVNTAVFFYPLEGATDFRYYEADEVADSSDLAKYKRVLLSDKPVFNGYLRRFDHEVTDNDRMGIVTFKTPGQLHVCNPIRLKTNSKPTELNNESLSITANNAMPFFQWQAGIATDNVIYFQVVSDEESDLISGTYTVEERFTFYTLDNVVLNITPDTPTPSLSSGDTYTFTLMGVSEDNWVNLMMEKSFEIP